MATLITYGNSEGTRRCTRCENVYPATFEFFHYRTRKRQSFDSHCRKCKREIHDRWAEQNRQYLRNRAEAIRRKNRLTALQHYSNGDPACVCCGEQRLPFLALDHIEGGGNKHRKEVGRGGTFFVWLARAGYPPGYRVLCHNCNWAMGVYGRCPHEDERAVKVATLITYGNSEGMRRCDARCHDATEPNCDCLCNGANHGVGLQQALRNTREMAEGWIDEYCRQNNITREDFTVFIGEGVRQGDLF